MRLTNLALAAVLGLGLVTGCDDDKKTGGPAPTPGGDAAKTVTDAAKKAGDATADAAKATTDAAKAAADAAAKAAEDLKNKVADIRKNPMIDAVIKALENGKADDADTALKGAEAAKLTLPEQIQKILPKLREVVNKVKGGEKFDMKMLEGLWK